MSEKTWQWHVEQSAHHLALGQTEIYLGSQSTLDGLPWEFAVGGEEGGSFRWSMPVSFVFHATHPCGLRFRWFIDLELPGSGVALTANWPMLRQILERLPGGSAKEFRAWLIRCADGIAERGKEAAREAEKQMSIAGRIRAMAQ